MLRTRLAVLVSACALFAAACSTGGGASAVICVNPDVPALDGDVGDAPAPGDEGVVDGPRDLAETGDEGDAPSDVEAEIPAKGTFGAVCQSNNDCISQYCVEGAEGFVCTQVCTDECPAGWLCRSMLIGADVVSLCIPIGAQLCKECKLDAQCGDGLCLDTAEGKVCGRDCSVTACPIGYVCSDVPMPEGSGTTKQCRPKSGACDCNVVSQGVKRPCVSKNAIGSCLGFETCDMNKGWMDCTALEAKHEECNGVDDDCNGIADDNPSLPTDRSGALIPCTHDVPGVGTCGGQWVCQGKDGWTCVGAVPKPETCNYQDDNCDGKVDEPFMDADGKKYIDIANCGQCGNSCVNKIPFAKTTICDATPDTPSCVVTECQTGYYKASDILCLPQISNLCMPCAEDVNCGATGDKCITYPTTKACGRNCLAGSFRLSNF